MERKRLENASLLLSIVLLAVIGLVAYRKWIAPPPVFTFEARENLNGDLAVWVQNKPDAISW